MTPPQSIQRATFVLRLWREPGALPGLWRGELEHIQANVTLRAADLPALVAHLCQVLDRLEAASADGLPPGPLGGRLAGV